MLDSLVNLSAKSLLAAFGGVGTIHSLASQKGIIESSWVVHIPAYWKLKKEEFENVWSKHPDKFNKIKIMGKEIEVPRYQQAFGMDYKFSGSVAASLPMDELPVALEFRNRVNAALTPKEGEQYNGALVNWYDGSLDHYIGLHKDDEGALLARAPIFSISWGQTRRFRLKHDKNVKRDGTRDVTLDLGDGDLVVMGGECQTTHKHEIMKLLKNEPRNRRINITLRIFKGRLLTPPKPTELNTGPGVCQNTVSDTGTGMVNGQRTKNKGARRMSDHADLTVSREEAWMVDACAAIEEALQQQPVMNPNKEEKMEIRKVSKRARTRI